MEFSEKLKNLMAEHGLTQPELAEIVGTSQQQISRWTGGGKPKWYYLLKMARALGVTVDYLIDPQQVERSAGAGLGEGERSILNLCKALHLDAEEALRRLAGPGAVPTGAGDHQGFKEPAGTSKLPLDTPMPEGSVSGESKPKGQGQPLKPPRRPR